MTTQQTTLKPCRHYLKAHPQHFEDVIRHLKTVELRKNDRDFKAGDILQLDEYDPRHGYTGRRCRPVKVTHVITDGEWLTEGYCALSIQLGDSVSRVDALRAEVAELKIHHSTSYDAFLVAMSNQDAQIESLTAQNATLAEALEECDPCDECAARDGRVCTCNAKELRDKALASRNGVEG